MLFIYNTVLWASLSIKNGESKNSISHSQTADSIVDSLNIARLVKKAYRHMNCRKTQTLELGPEIFDIFNDSLVCFPMLNSVRFV